MLQVDICAPGMQFYNKNMPVSHKRYMYRGIHMYVDLTTVLPVPTRTVNARDTALCRISTSFYEKLIEYLLISKLRYINRFASA